MESREHINRTALNSRDDRSEEPRREEQPSITEPNEQPALERGLGLKEAVALNMIDMIGIGPFVVSPLVIRAMGGPPALLAWCAGAVLALLDGFVWSELGAALPKAGGSYVFLREAYGPERWGRLMSFLFVWQTLIQAPLVIASGAIGFAQYASYLHPLGMYQQKAVSGVVVLFLIVLLYRRITTIGKISVLLWAGVIGTMIWLIAGGVTHFNARMAFSIPPGTLHFSRLFFAGLGAAMINTTYTYWGYYNICHLGGELRQPEKNIPRGIFISIGGIAVLYLAMQVSILGVVPWQKAQNSQFLVSTFVETVSGPFAARIATLLVLWIAFASIFSALLGYSRVPYAAALDGNFFSVFARVHPEKKFPHVALLFLGGVAFFSSLLFRLSTVIAAILATRLLVQFIGQAVGVMLLHRRWSADRFPFKMWLYPLPAFLTACGWAALFWATGPARKWGLLVIALGGAAFLLRAREMRGWPFGPAAAAHE
ncbi:MAG TPA: APC family permease [Candidatus Dormibacteraeota bacterium]|nr:APC family permease [Candidatus Dormibacteraeota bacterium]